MGLPCRWRNNHEEIRQGKGGWVEVRRGSRAAARPGHGDRRCNIPFSEYVPSYVFRFMIVFFGLLPIFVLFYEYLCDHFALDPDS